MPTSFNQSVIEEFRARGGEVGGPFEGSRLVLLTAPGARTGTQHTVPLAYLPDGDRILVIASAAGAERDPQWFRNLLAAGGATVEDGVFTYQVRPVVLTGAERDAAYARAVEANPGWAEYQRRTARTIPVVALEPAGPPRPTATTFAEGLKRIHDAFRRELDLVRREVASAGPGIGVQLRANCLSVCQGLHHHHTMEDAGMLPMIAQQHPHLAGAVDRLRAEHEQVAALLERLREVTSEPGADRDRVLAEVDRLVEQVRAHLDYEEEQLLPVLDVAFA